MSKQRQAGKQMSEQAAGREITDAEMAARLSFQAGRVLFDGEDKGYLAERPKRMLQ